MQQAPKFNTDAIAALAEDTRRMYHSRRQEQEHMAVTREAIAQSRALMAEVDIILGSG
jgi:hypothetical protein